MLCEKCRKNEAKIHVVMLMNGEKKETALCEECAKKLSNLKLGMDFGNVNEVEIQKLLSIFDNKNAKKGIDISLDIVCKNCGQTYSQFRKSNKLGCVECYKSFSDLLEEYIQSYHKNIEHIGKIPKSEGNKLFKQKTLIKLKDELTYAVIEEDYEKAAVIRDQIKEIESEEAKVHEFEKLEY